MTTTIHPDDLELFEYVEGDLDEARHPAVAAHVGACERCAEEVRLLEAGKDALRGSPLLAFPPRSREALLRGLPRQAERERVRFALSPRRLVAVLAPVAVVAIAVTVILSTSENGEGERAAVPAEPAAAEALESTAEAEGAAVGEASQAEAPAPAGDAAGVEESAPAEEPEPAAKAPAEDPAPAEEAAPLEEAPSLAAPGALRAVAGPPDAVVALLRRKGLDASVVEGRVEVRNAAPAAVATALAGRAAGDVEVVVVP